MRDLIGNQVFLGLVGHLHATGLFTPDRKWVLVELRGVFGVVGVFCEGNPCFFLLNPTHYHFNEELLEHGALQSTMVTSICMSLVTGKLTSRCHSVSTT